MDAVHPLISQVRASHFRSLGALTLDLGPLTVLVGPNGAGKSNVVAVLRFLRDAAARGLSYACGEQGGSPTIPQRGHEVFSAGVTFRDLHGRVDYDVAVARDADTPIVRSENLRLDTRGGLDLFSHVEGGVLTEGSDFGHALSGVRGLNLLEPHVVLSMFDSPMTERRDLEDARRLVEWMPGWLKRTSVYPPAVGLLRAPQREASSFPLDESGNNLAAVLASIRETPDGQTFDQALERLVDGAVGYHVEQAAGFLVTFVDYAGQGDGRPTASDLGLESDGTVRMLAMLAALYQTPPRSLVVLEEPEAGLHPGALPVLADLIKEASTRTQVLVTTHSPDLIDCFDPDVLRVVEKVNGETRVGLVRPQQREAVRRKLFSPGELMRMEGLQLDLD